MFLAPLTRLLAAAGILPLSPAPVEPIGALNVQDGGAGSLTFTLRQTHAMSPTHPGRVVWRDLASDSSFKPEDNAFTLSTKQVKSSRPRSLEAFHAARSNAFRDQAQSIDWDEHIVPGPDHTSRETLLSLAKMASNAYYGNPNEKGWLELGDEWSNTTFPVGWEPDADGFRGHVFSTPDNKTVVLSIKGTTVALVGGGGPTIRKDKLNDNLLFSCCCAKVGPTWSAVCNCHAGGWKCDNSCVQQALAEDSLFYPVGTNLYNNITHMYPNANIWLVGHSLGGSLASLLGVTFGVPVVAFEAPAERMAARRLHLPLPRSTEHIIHLFNTGDPIPMGTCTGVLSACANAGYAMEGRCHLGKKIVYDTMSKWKWSSSINNHLISVVIDKLLAQDWDEAPPDVPPPTGPQNLTLTSPLRRSLVTPRQKQQQPFGWRDAFGFAIGGGHGKKPEPPKHIGEVPDAVDEDAECDETECYGWEFGDYGKA